MKRSLTTRQTRLPPARGAGAVEVLVAICIIFGLMLVMLAIIDPDRRYRDARDDKRRLEAGAILNAILDWQVDRRGEYLGEASAPVRRAHFAQVIVTDDEAIDCTDEAQRPGCDQVLDVGQGKNCVINIGGIGPDKLIPEYLSAVPVDPRDRSEPAACSSTSNCKTKGDLFYGPRNSGYYLRWRSGRLEVGSCQPERAPPIRVLR